MYIYHWELVQWTFKLCPFHISKIFWGYRYTWSKTTCLPPGWHEHTIWYRSMFYSLNKKEWICSLFKEWMLEKSEIRVNLEWTFVLFTHFGVTTRITQGFRVIPEVTPKWVNNTTVHSKFTLISLFSKIHSFLIFTP